MAASDGQTQALAEALRQGERILDHQVGMAAAARADAESVVRLSVATLGGLIAVGAAMRAATATHEVVSLVGFGLATGTVFAAVLLAAFAGGRLGSGLGLTVGPTWGSFARHALKPTYMKNAYGHLSWNRWPPGSRTTRLQSAWWRTNAFGHSCSSP